MLSAVPTTLYRYRAFDSRTIDSLCQDRLFFASPSSFNDPLDCMPTIIPNSSLDTLRDLLKFLIHRRVDAETTTSLSRARVEGERARAYARRRASEAASRELQDIAYRATNPEYETPREQAEIHLLTSQIEMELMRHYERGVCCFSTAYNSPLLWSHYGDQHKGICIGYDLERNPKPTLHKVVYGGNRNILTSTIARALLDNEPVALQDLDRDVLLRKAAGWKYEREWRLIGSHGIQDSCVRLKEVTFGLRCSSAARHCVIRALDRRDPLLKFYEIRAGRGTFRLHRTAVDQDKLGVYLPATACSAEEMFPDGAET